MRRLVVVLVIFVLMLLGVISVVMDLRDERRLRHRTFQQMLKSNAVALLLTAALTALAVTDYPMKWRFRASLNAFESLRANEAAIAGEVPIAADRRFVGMPIERRVGLYYVVDVWREDNALRIRCCDGFWRDPQGFIHSLEPNHPSDIMVHMVDDWYWWRWTK